MMIVINIRWTGNYNEVEIKFDNTTIDFGLLNEEECKSLAKEFTDAAYELKRH